MKYLRFIFTIVGGFLLVNVNPISEYFVTALISHQSILKGLFVGVIVLIGAIPNLPTKWKWPLEVPASKGSIGKVNI